MKLLLSIFVVALQIWSSSSAPKKTSIYSNHDSSPRNGFARLNKVSPPALPPPPYPSLSPDLEKDDTSGTGKTREELINSGHLIPFDIFLVPPPPPGILSMPPTSIFETPDQIQQREEAELKDTYDNMNFYLYTPKNPTTPAILTFDLGSFEGTNWDRNGKVNILIHGLWQNGDTEGMPIAVKDAYLKSGSIPNIICVDWGNLAYPFSFSGWYFLNAAPNTFRVGKVVGDFIDNLVKSELVKSLNDVHIVGFSLGAHVAGVAGNRVLTKTGGLVSRITGLDPAGPAFGNSTSLEKRLDSTDASFVDIIHTNMGEENPLNNYGAVRLGTKLEIGHVDFYPNGGEVQPGCESWWWGNYFETCSHGKAPEYFAKSIDEGSYIGCHCEDWNSFENGTCGGCPNPAMMGEMCELTRATASGRYYCKI